MCWLSVVLRCSHGIQLLNRATVIGQQPPLREEAQLALFLVSETILRLVDQSALLACSHCSLQIFNVFVSSLSDRESVGPEHKFFLNQRQPGSKEEITVVVVVVADFNNSPRVLWTVLVFIQERLVIVACPLFKNRYLLCLDRLGYFESVLLRHHRVIA